jgi:adenylosuccinate synthase
MPNKKYSAVAVIGGGYGDEGKGLLTDYYASTIEDPVVIRSNGGAQAGHTVVTPDGRRHVFSHFSSGTFAGAPTYLSEFFVVNPTLFVREHKAFVKEFGFAPKIYVHPHALVTSPFEMLVNQSLEHMRGDDPHGSCGVGFGETFERKKRIHLLWGMSYIKQILVDMLREDFDRLRDVYIPQRVDLKQVSQTFIDVINSEELFENFIDVLMYMMDHVEVTYYDAIWDRNVIFEGAQGLLLDQDYGHFPHVTRSNTGMRNVLTIMDQLSVTDFRQLDVNYATRAYTTRHGAGPLEFEQPMPDWVVDETNKHNEWQGSLRYAPLNWDLFESITNKDFALYGNEHNGYYDVQMTRTVTCVDQLPENNAQLITKDAVFDFHPDILKEQIFPQMFDVMSFGPTRNDIKPINGM